LQIHCYVEKDIFLKVKKTEKNFFFKKKKEAKKKKGNSA